MNYNVQLYNNLTTNLVKATAVKVLLCLICLFILIKLYNIITKRRKTCVNDRQKLNELKKEMDEMINKK